MTEKVVFLGMGGTIAGTAGNAADNVGYTAAQVLLVDLLRAIPGVNAALNDCELVCHQIAQVDSKDLEFSHWTALAREVSAQLVRPDVRGLVIAHGTDTLEETAYFLAKILPVTLIRHKPVVFTCAMRPSSSTSPDGPQNIVDAAAVASLTGAFGVLVVCASTIHAARNIQKVHPYRLDAFDSGEAGPIGFVENGRVRMVNCWPEGVEPSAADFLDTAVSASWPRVEILISCVGATGATVRAICSESGSEQRVRGIVVAGTGNATIHHDLANELEQAEKSGVRVLRTSRCAYGSVVSNSTDGRAVSVSPVKARIDLILELMMKKKAA